MLKLTPRKITILITLLFSAAFSLQLFFAKVRVDSFTASEHWLPSAAYWLQEKALFWDRVDYDRRVVAKPSSTPDPRVVVVEINEPSLAELGQFPFSRSIYADFIRTAAKAGAKVVAFDILFSEPERNEALAEFDRLAAVFQNYKIKGPALEYLSARKAKLDSDRILAEALDGSIDVVWGYPFLSPVAGIQLSHQIENDAEEYPIPALTKRQLSLSDLNYQAIFHGFNPVFPLEKLREGKGVHFGSFNAAVDGDSVIREASLVFRHNDQIYPALSIAALAAYTKKPFYLSSIENNLVLAQDGGYSVPLENAGRIYVNYYGFNKTIPTYEFVDVLKGKHNQDLKNKIIFLGVTAVGLKDLRGTPFSSDFPGVEVHATVASNILQNKYTSRGSDYAYGGYLAILLLCLLIAVATYRFSPGIAVGGAFAILFVLDRAGQYLFNHGFFIPTVLPSLAGVAMLSAGVLQKYLSAVKEKKFVREAFSRYVSGAVVDEIIKDPARLRLGGQKKELTVLFSDMVGFTKLSEHLSADKLTEMLNEYFTCMTKVVLDNSGTLDKYIGDAIMCFWGAPIDVSNHARLACKAALGMQQELIKLNMDWRSRYGIEVGTRIGINTGEMAVGNMGSEQVFNYTVLGDNVNLGSRIEGVNNLFGTKILVGHRTRDLAKDNFLFRHIDTVAVKGRETPEALYELIGDIADAEKLGEWLTCYHEAIDAYKSGDWSQAEAGFKRAQQLNSNDQAPKVFLERIERLKQNTPKDWQGVWVLTEK